MFAYLGNDKTALHVACDVCGLDFFEGCKSFVWENLPTLPGWMEVSALTNPRSRPNLGVLSLRREHAELCSRTPHEVGVFFHSGRLWLVWDPTKDGYGLTSFIGENGRRLVSAYQGVAVERVAERLGLCKHTERVEFDETIIRESIDIMAQKTITVRISPKGEATVKTSGFEGKSCQEATKQLEEALGTVVTDTPTSGDARTQSQTVQVDNSGG